MPFDTGKKKVPIPCKNFITSLIVLNALLQIDGIPVTYTGQSSIRESFPRCVSEPLAVVSITLQGMADDGPSKAVYHHIHPYLRGNACYVNLDYNFGTAPDLASFSDRLNSLVDAFETGELQRYVNGAFKYS